MATIVNPVRPGTTIRFIGEVIPAIAPSLADIVAVPITTDWGPLVTETGGLKSVSSLLQFDATYGNSDTSGRRAVILALNGQGPGAGGGAGTVVVARMATAAAAKATATLTNVTGATPALTLSAKYKGIRGNRISATVADDPSDVARDILRIRLDGVDQERYAYENADIAGLAADINARSTLVTAAVLVTGTALTVTAGVTLTGGSNGAALTGTEYSATLAALEFERFSIIAFENLTDAAIRATVVAWVQGMSDSNRPVMLIVGGAAGETVADALARTVLISDPHVVNVGVGTYHDDLLNLDLSTAQLAPRIAGVLASRGEERSLTFAKVAGLSSVGTTGPDGATIEAAILGGVTVLSRSTSPDSLLKIEKGVTTFTNKADAARPIQIFSDARLVRVMDLYVRGMKEWGDEFIIGDTTVNEDTRTTVKGEGRSRQDDLERRGLIIPGTGFFNVIDTTGDPVLMDTIPFDFGWLFSRTTNFLYGNGRVR